MKSFLLKILVFFLALTFFPFHFFLGGKVNMLPLDLFSPFFSSDLRQNYNPSKSKLQYKKLAWGDDSLSKRLISKYEDFSLHLKHPWQQLEAALSSCHPADGKWRQEDP